MPSEILQDAPRDGELGIDAQPGEGRRPGHGQLGGALGEVDPDADDDRRCLGPGALQTAAPARRTGSAAVLDALRGGDQFAQDAGDLAAQAPSGRIHRRCIGRRISRQDDNVVGPFRSRPPTGALQAGLEGALHRETRQQRQPVQTRSGHDRPQDHGHGQGAVGRRHPRVLGAPATRSLRLGAQGGQMGPGVDRGRIHAPVGAAQRGAEVIIGGASDPDRQKSGEEGAAHCSSLTRPARSAAGPPRRSSRLRA